MRKLLALATLAASTGMADADEVVLKSGARGDMSMAVTTAPEDLGGAGAGNVVELYVKLASLEIERPDVEGSSICLRYGQSTYAAVQDARDTLPDAMTGVLDLSLPLAAVRVIFNSDVGDGASIQIIRDYDMRGVRKCRPIE